MEIQKLGIKKKIYLVILIVWFISKATVFLYLGNQKPEEGYGSFTTLHQEILNSMVYIEILGYFLDRQDEYGRGK